VAARLLDVLNHDLVAAYVFGSGALGDFSPDKSDIDIAAVCVEPLSREAKEAVAAPLWHCALPCPARGLELVLYRRDAVAAGDPAFELNLNTGAFMESRLSLDIADEPKHWFVIDLAIGRVHGHPLVGPRPDRVIGPIPPEAVLDALMESLDWYSTAGEDESVNAVLNACRAWRFAEENAWSSKVDAAAWALPRTEQRILVEQALALRRGEASGKLDPDAVREFSGWVRARVAAAR
jgi:hypothetical protein